MKKTMKLFGIAFMALSLTLTSCSKDGDDGLDGAQGEQGIPGTDGQDGEDGEDGNANVTSLLLEDQTISTGDNVYDVSELTQEIFDTGFVFAYVTVNGNDYWETLPLSISQQIILEIDKIELGRITLRSTFTQSNLRLRFIFVEARSLSSKIANKNVQKMSYEEAMDYFELDY